MSHHIVLISLDALRPDGLGCYGNPRKPSKNIDMVAEEGLLFQRAYTPATWTLPAHMSMLSGLEPPVHGCVSPRHRYPPQTIPFPLIFELAQRAGYAPLSVTGGGYMEPEFGFGRGIDDYRVIFPIQEALDAVSQHIHTHEQTFTFFHTYTVHDYPRIQSAPKILELQRQRDPDYRGLFPTDEDFHALITALGDSVEQPEPGERDLSYLRDIYEGSVRIADATLGAFFGRLDALRVWDDSTVILTSDHGESLGEQHGRGLRHYHHGGPPYQHQLHIPLIIRPAEELQGLMEPGQSVEQMVSLIDLAPTMMDMMDAPYSRDQFDGSSLVDLGLGQIAAFETRRLFFHSCHDPEDRYLDQRLYGGALTWRDNGKMIYDPRNLALREFYWLERDPDEQHNAIDELEQAELRRIDETIRRYWQDVEARAKNPPAEPIDDPKVLERLAELGYIDV